MEAFHKLSSTVKGVEVLYFEDAEVEKYRSDKVCFAATGPLTVLYFKDDHRFVLQLNDWKYPLLRRLRVVCNSEETNLMSRSYLMPGTNGYTFQLKINKITNLGALNNLEAILRNESDLHLPGQTTHKPIEKSPDDKLVRKTVTKDTGIKETLGEKTMHFVHKMKVKMATMKTGTKYLTSTKRRIDVTKIKNKNFRKTAKPTFKKNYFKDNLKMTEEFMKKRYQNENNLYNKDISALGTTSESKAPVHFVMKEDIEEAILNNKDIATHGNYNLIMRTADEKKNVLDDIRKDLDMIKENVELRKEELKEKIRIREARIESKMEEKMHHLDSLHHSEA